MMVSITNDLASELASLYSRSPADIDLVGFVRGRLPGDEELLADLIETDGRCRIDAGLPVDLARYLDAIPDLQTRPSALDAAIDMALRWLSRSSKPTADAVQTLIAAYPSLAHAVRNAAELNLAVWSTSQIVRGVGGGRRRPARTTPCDFGPRRSDGTARYQLMRPLGSGAAGDVYESIDRQLSEPGHDALVAIKILRTDAQHDRARTVFFEEATKARRVRHPGVVRVEDCGISDSGEPFLVYEYMQGGDLQGHLGAIASPLPVRRAVSMIARIARGVHAAHTAGLIHCDLKPSNIMLDAEGEPRVADFGVAVRLWDRVGGAGIGDRGSHTEPRDCSPWAGPEPGNPAPWGPLGNVAFMSPEQFRMDEGGPTSSSDVYALGGLLFYLLTRQLPNGSTPQEIAGNHDRETGRCSAPWLRELNPKVDEDLESICRRALSPNPADRHESAAALADDLQRWLRREPIGWTRPSSAKVVKLWAQRRPGVATLLILLVIAVAAGSGTGGWFYIVASERRVHEADLRSELARKEFGEAEARAAAWTEHAGWDRIRTFIGRAVALTPQSQMELSSSILAETMMMEWFYSPRIVFDPERLGELWRKRIGIMRRLVNERLRAGRDSDVETLLMEITLGHWLTLDGNPVEAEQVLDRTARKWAALGYPRDDPFFVRLEAIRNSAAARRVLDSVAASSASPALTCELNRLTDLLTVAESTLRKASGRTPVHLLVLWALRDIYGSGGLHDENRLALVKVRLVDYEELAYARPALRDVEGGAKH